MQLYFAINGFALPDDAALVGYRGVTAGLIGCIFQQNVVSLTVRTYVEAERPSRQYRPLRKMGIRECGAFWAAKCIRRPLNISLATSTSHLANVPCMDLYTYSAVLMARNVLTAALRLACSLSEDCAGAVCPR